MYIDDDYEVANHQQRFLEEVNFHASHLLGYHSIKFVDASEMDIPTAYMQPNYEEHSLKINRAIALPSGSYELSRKVMSFIYDIHFFKWFHLEMMH